MEPSGRSETQDYCGDSDTERSLDEDQIVAQNWLTLGVFAYEQFEHTGCIEDVDRAIEYWGTALKFILSRNSHLEVWGLIGNLGQGYKSRFERLGELSDLEDSILFRAEAVSLTLDGDPDKPGRLRNLGTSYLNRFERLGELADLSKAIELQTRAISLTSNGHPDRPTIFSSLGNSYLSRFERLGELSDLEKAVELQTQAISLTSDGHADGSLAGCLSNLGVSHLRRFKRLGELSNLNKAIELQTQAVSLTPDGHPDKPACLNNLGISYSSRFESLGDLSDLNKAIELETQVISLTPDGHPGQPRCLSNHGSSYQMRFERLGKLSDLNNAIELQTRAVSLTPDGHPDKPAMLDNLGRAYINYFERLGELSDLKKAVEFQTQAILRTPDGHPDKSAMLRRLGNSYRRRFKLLGEPSDLNKAIELQTQAVSLIPDGHPDKPGCLGSLGSSYLSQFERLAEISDLNKAVEFQIQAVSLTPSGHPDEPGCLSSLGSSYIRRFERLGELSDLNKAIEFQTQAVSLTPDGHPDKPALLHNLGVSYSSQLGSLGEFPDLNKAIELQGQAIFLTPEDHPDKPTMLNSLGSAYHGRFERLGELSDLNKAIELQTQAVSLTPDGRPAKPIYLSNLGNAYMSRFERLGELSDLNKEIESQQQAVRLSPGDHPNRPLMLSNLGESYRSRFECIGELSDLQSAESSFRMASQSLTGSPSIRFRASRQLAGLSLIDSVSSPLPACQQAMSLVPQLVWIGNTIGRRYKLTTKVSAFATGAASHAISAGAYILALEWLEGGRSIVWSQIAQLRDPFKDLSDRDSKLAEDLANVGRQLELAGSQSSQSLSPNTSGPDSGQEASAHIQLALRWDRLLKDIRSMPELEDFLCPPKASRLLGAAKTHPIAIINVNQSRCDALIIRPGCDTVSHVALTNFSSEGAILAHHHLLPQVRDRTLRPRLKPLGARLSLLENLWLGVVKPVLDFLGYTRKLPVNQLPRLTWCTTGLLSFLPLHAARSQDESQPSAFDLVISSYTPTLSALLSSKSAGPSPTCGILAVGQENTPGFSNLPCTTRELAVIRKHARSNCYLQLQGDEAGVEQVLDAMNQFSWVHMACHGSQDIYDPMQSSFHLHGGDLTLAAITKRSFTNKGLAFLSACQTATGDRNMPDEAVHLAAGMLMAGYPSVIGTMWNIADEDGPEVADLVYAELLKDGKMDHTNSARALHRAVANLRAKVGEKDIARWASFIHMGS